ncbi:MAG: DUF5710 domain-containing protein [Pseudomonadota bacterium]
MTESTTNLKVPFSEKDQAKSLGAKWNAELKQWYVPQGVDAKPFEKWFTNTPAAPKSITETHSIDSRLDDDDIEAINAKLRDAYEFREAE